MKSANTIRHTMFTLRCAASAAAAYLLAEWVGLLHPVWAPMSALIVSQERLADTRASLTGRILGTLLGMAAAVLVDTLTRPWGIDMSLQIAAAVAICAAIARTRPQLRVSMWTGPIVLLTPSMATSVMVVALFRGLEVILGSIVGVVLHWAAERILQRILNARRPAKKLFRQGAKPH
jgi:uncharacterized membrane protein YccC